MPRQPMGSMSGMAPGIFQRNTNEKQLDKALYEQQKAHHEAGLLLEGLEPGVVIVGRELENLINQFLSTDPQAAILVRVIASWRNIIELVPRLATEKVNKLLGPQLAAVRKETQAAP